MKKKRTPKLVLFSLSIMLLFTPQLIAQEASISDTSVVSNNSKSKKNKVIHQKQKDWNIFLTTYYTSRKIKGDITRENALTGGGSSNLLATGNTLDLNKSNGFMYGLGLSYKRWFLGLTYMPSMFNDQGNGYSYFDLEGQDGTGILTKVATKTNVNINMYLANIMYEAVRTKHTSFKAGIGVGASSVIFDVTPQDSIVKGIGYNHTQPFGYITLNMATNYKGFLFSANTNGVMMTIDGINITYLDFTTQLGYRVYQDYFNIDIIVGYRMVNFAISGSEQTDGPPPVTHTYGVDLTLEGLFFGITLSY